MHKSVNGLGPESQQNLRAFLSDDGCLAVKNVRCRLLAVDVGGYACPATLVTENFSENSYVVSTYNAFFRYVCDEIDRAPAVWARPFMHCLVRVLSCFFDADILDRCLIFNNWLVSTNLYPVNWCADGIEDFTQDVCRRYPHAAVMFRSLNPVLYPAPMARLRRAGYIQIASRQVYMIDCRNGPQSDCLRKKDTKNDLSLFRRMNYRIVAADDLMPDDWERSVDLYRMLYLQKYCALNPDYTAAWLKSGHRNGWLDLRFFRAPNGRIDAVVGWMKNDGVLTTPIFGYDTSLPQELGLYRMMTVLCLQEAASRRCYLHMSSGAAGFKRLRGGKPCIEYSAVYCHHLNWRARTMWKFVGFLTRFVAAPLIQLMRL